MFCVVSNYKQKEIQCQPRHHVKTVELPEAIILKALQWYFTVYLLMNASTQP